MEDIPKVYSISQDYSEYLNKEGLRLAKLCGRGIEGFKHAMAMGYLEGLATKRAFHSSNLIYLYPLLSSLRQNEKINEVFNLITKIQNNEISQNEIVAQYRASELLRSQLSKFSEFLFQIPEHFTEDLNSLIESYDFSSSLSELNIQLHFYDYTTEKTFKKIKISNTLIHPIMILVLFNSSESDQRIFNLYKKDFRIVAENNLNTTMVFNKEHRNDCLVEKLEDVLKILQEFS